MKKCVFLNSSRIDFDRSLDFSPIEKVSVVTYHGESSPEEIPRRVEGQQVVITKEIQLAGEMIGRFPDSVELICEAGTGYNNIDTLAARKRGIAVCNIPNYSTEAVAHLVITFLLNWSASLGEQQAMVRRKDFDNFTRSPKVRMFELTGKTIGLIGGSGAIGFEVAKIARALGMKVLINCRTPREWEDPEVRWAALDDLLRQSDAISIHCPLTAETRHLIDSEKLRLMKPSAFLINTARGPIVKEDDLIEALGKGVIAGAGLDVQDPEPPDPENPLFSMENVIMTPHMGWKRLETRQRLIDILGGNIAAHIKGEAINVVN